MVASNLLGKGRPRNGSKGEEHMKDEDDDIQVYQRPWVGLTEAQFLEAVRLAENGNYLVAFVRIQEWLKEKNNG